MKCEDSFYFSNQKCTPGNVAHCRVYKGLECVECEEYFVLKGQSCKLGPVLNCLSYKEEKCSECEADFCLLDDQCLPSEKCLDKAICGKSQLRVVLLNQCVESVVFCEIYDEENKCIKCLKQYRLEDNVCLKIAESDPCIEYMLSGCLTCREGFVLRNNECKKTQVCEVCAER